ncbi:MAG: type II secretion system protein [Actinobacteria bacterium]|nr:type II secretion system protein [Actinomycetota bacterium]
MNLAITRIIKQAKAKIVKRESGFTLTELAIGMLVVGILASVAVPSFLGARNNAYDKEAQMSLGAVLNAATILYQNQGDFSDATTAQCGDSTTLAADIQKLEPGIDAVAASASSTNPQVVSVQAAQTWSSNSELLGCQAFYATAISRSGSCWIVRFTVEGKFLSSGTTLPIYMATQLNTQNAAVTTWTLLQVNGKAFAYIRGRSTGADADNTNGLAAIGTACKASTQGTGSAGSTANVIKSTEFYNSWKDVQAGANGSNS